MADEKATKQYEMAAPLAPVRDGIDYVYNFRAFSSKELTHTTPVVWAGPENIDGLDETPAFKLMKERYGMDPRDVFNEALGRIATKPGYPKSDTGDADACVAAQREAQKLVDEFKYDRPKASTGGQRIKAKKLDALDQMAVEAGFANAEEMAAYAAEMKAKKGKK